MNISVINQIKLLMKQKGKSYQSLADELGISKALVGHLLSGERKITSDRLLEISHALQCDVKTLVSPPSSEIYGPLTVELRGSITDRKSKRSLEKALYAIEDYVMLRGSSQ